MITGTAVVDASVVVEYLCGLRLAANASRFFSALASESDPLEIWAPDLLYAECLSAFRTLRRRSLLSTAHAALSVEMLGRLPINIAGTQDLLGEVWSLRNKATAYDGVYLALASRIKSPLVTADKKLARFTSAKAPKVVSLEAI